MSLIFWRWVKTSKSSTGNERWVSEPTLEHLEECIDKLRAAPSEKRAIALDGLAYVAGEVMDTAVKEWETIVGRKWERYTD